MTPWYFEDFTPGAVIPTLRRTVTEADVMAFAGISGDFNVLHTDRVFAAETQFGEPIAHGLLGLSIVSGLMHQAGVINGTIISQPRQRVHAGGAFCVSGWGRVQRKFCSPFCALLHTMKNVSGE